jgi:hypothetical protein
MTKESPSRLYCSQISARAGEHLPGTATRTQVYFLLEDPSTWGEKAFEDSDLPRGVKDYLAAQVQAVQDGRILLIRREAGSVAGIHFFIAVVAEGEEMLFEFLLPDYSALLGLDIAAVISDPDRYPAYRRAAPLLLVCTHGRRDACCAKFGLPVYQALREKFGEIAWQCSHVGGHRFAANLLCLPSGLLYGRVVSENAASIAGAAISGQLVLEHYRGRVSYPPAAQAAEHALRESLGQTDIRAFGLYSAEETQPGRWRARFQDRITRQTHQVILQSETAETQVFDSCRMEKAMPVVEYRLVELRSFDTTSDAA